MPTPTYDLLASNVLTSSASSVTFSSIPATYRDLIVVCTTKSTTTYHTVYIRFNSDTGSNYPTVRAFGFTSAGSDSATYSFIDANLGIDAGNFQTTISNIMDYSATDKHKTVLSRANGTPNYVAMTASRWANTSAINSVNIFNATAVNFDSGSSFYLYGIVS